MTPNGGSIEAADLMARIASTLRHEVGPAVEGEYPKTQAFMASVILERVSRQLAYAEVHDRDERADRAELNAGLADLVADAPATVRDAWAATGPRVGDLGPVVAALHGWDDPRAGEALALIRPVLRRDIDRRMDIAR